MKKKSIVFLLMALSFNIWGLKVNGYLEFKDINNFDVVEDKANFSFHITGLCMKSNYVIKNVVYETNDDRIKVLIKISIFKKKNETGRFDYELKVPQNINSIVLGNDEVEVWKRG